jgi:hypothetical protein
MAKNVITEYFQTALRIFVYHINRVVKLRISRTPAFWDSQNEFNALYEQIRKHTVVSKNRCFMLYQLLNYTRNLDGDIAEVGVYKGGTAKLIVKTVPEKNVHLFDTFQGMPQICTEVDTYKGKEFSDVSLESVKSFLADCSNVTFYPGIFPETAGPVKNKKFSFVYIDADIYKSVKDSLEFFYSRMVKGGVILLDDYDSLACPGVKKAVCEFLSGKKEYPIITMEIQCAIIKL